MAVNKMKYSRKSRKRNKRIPTNFEMTFMQLNQRKCKNCSDYINRKTNGMESFIHLGQEPHAHKGKITGLNNLNQLFHSGDENPRAYIYMHIGLGILDRKQQMNAMNEHAEIT